MLCVLRCITGLSEIIPILGYACFMSSGEWERFWMERNLAIFIVKQVFLFARTKPHHLTDRGRDKLGAICHDNCMGIFSMETFEFKHNFKEICSLWSNWQHASIGSDNGAEQATSHYLKQCRDVVLTQICVTWPQWVNQTSRHHCNL